MQFVINVRRRVALLKLKIEPSTEDYLVSFKSLGLLNPVVVFNSKIHEISKYAILFSIKSR